VKYSTYVEYRDRSGLNDYQISLKLCYIPSVFSDWKYGRSTPKLDKQMKIAKLLKIPNSKILETDTKEEVDARKDAHGKRSG